MRKFASIPPSIWQTEIKAIRGDLEAVVVYFHLTTCSHANMLGLYYMPLAYIAHETGSPLEGASKGLNRLIEARICSYDHERELVWVHEMATQQVAPHLSPKDKRVKGIAEQLAMLPICPTTLGFYSKYRIPYHLHDERNLEDFELAFEAQAPSPSEGPSQPLRSKEKDEEKDLGEGKGPVGLGVKEVSEGTNTRETMFTPFPKPSSTDEARHFLDSQGVPHSKMTECIQLIMGGNLSPYDLEGICQQTRTAEAA